MRRPTFAFLLGTALLGQGAALGQPKPEAAPPEVAKPAPLLSELATPELAAPHLAEAERPDPPALAGRVARLAGNSQYRLPGQEAWQPAQLNFPVTSGHAIWTGPGARAALQVGTLRLALESDSRLEFAAADDNGLTLVLAQGSLFLLLPPGSPALPIRVTTPRGDALLPGPGQMLVQAGAEDRATRIAVLAGQGSVEAEGLAPLLLTSGEAMALTGTSPPEAQREPAGPPPPLLAWAQRQGPRGNLPAAVAGMTGAEDLSQHGEWRQSVEHGDLWLPPVQPGWAPYRQGHWAHVEPWGWNWVDDAPWGFAPFHYGRWVEWDNGWAWAPGYATPGTWPVYAPALVSFFPGLRPGWLGWAPLRPWQAYQPPYWVSLPWFRRLNQGHVRDLGSTEAWWRQHRFVPPPGSFHTIATTLAPLGSFGGGRALAPFALAHRGMVAGPVLARPGLAPALAAGVGAGLLMPRMLARPALPPAMGQRPAAPFAGLAPQAPAPAFRAPAPTAGKPALLGAVPRAPGGAPGSYATGKPGGWGGPAPASPGRGYAGSGIPGGGNPGGGYSGGGYPGGGYPGGGYATGKPGGWGGAPPSGHHSAPPPQQFGGPPRHFSAPAPHYSPPAHAFNAPSFRAPPSYHTPPASNFRAPPASGYHAPASNFHAPPAQSFRAPSAPSYHAPSAPSRPAPSSASRSGSTHHR